MNLKQQIYHVIVDHHRRFGQVPRRDELRNSFRHDSEVVVDNELLQLAREGLIVLGNGESDGISLTAASARPVTEIGIQGYASPGRGTVALDLGGIGLPLGDDTHALCVADDLMADAGIQTGDIAILRPGVPLRGDIVAALIDDRLVLRRFLVIRRIPHLLAENPGHPELRPAFDIQLQGILCALLRTDFGRHRSARSGPRAIGYLERGELPEDGLAIRADPERRLPGARQPENVKSVEPLSRKGKPMKPMWPQPPSGIALNEPAGACFDARSKKARRTKASRKAKKNTGKG